MLYRQGRGWLYRLNPLTKFAMLLPVLATLPSGNIGLVLLPGLFFIAFAGSVTMAGPLLWRMGLILLPVAVSVFAIHGLLVRNGAALSLGPVSVYPAGVALAALILARLFVLAAAALTIVMTTKLGDLADALEDKGVPIELCFLLTAPLFFADALEADTSDLGEALQVRGVDPQGNLLQRSMSLALTVLPLLRLLLLESGQRARGLDARGFRALPRRTRVEAPADGKAESRLRWALLAAALLIGVAQVWPS